MVNQIARRLLRRLASLLSPSAGAAGPHHRHTFTETLSLLCHESTRLQNNKKRDDNNRALSVAFLTLTPKTHGNDRLLAAV